jgi:hypothetical protein
MFLVASTRSLPGRLGSTVPVSRKRPARLYFFIQTLMEMERLLHATLSNGLSGPIFPHPSQKHYKNPLNNYFSFTNSPGGRGARHDLPAINNKSFKILQSQAIYSPETFFTSVILFHCKW